MALANGSLQACGNCRFFRTRETRTGEAKNCVRRSPVVLAFGMLAPQVAGGAPIPITQSFFPETDPTLWCGEWERDLKTADLSTLDDSEFQRVDTEGTA
jgi:hypothetical protein